MRESLKKIWKKVTMNLAISGKPKTKQLCYADKVAKRFQIIEGETIEEYILRISPTPEIGVKALELNDFTMPVKQDDLVDFISYLELGKNILAEEILLEYRSKHNAIINHRKSQYKKLREAIESQVKQMESTRRRAYQKRSSARFTPKVSRKNRRRRNLAII